MCDGRPVNRNSRHGTRDLLLLIFFTAGCVAVSALCWGLEAAEPEPAQEKSAPAIKKSLGPADTGFNSQGFRISKVVRIERSLNALGIAGQFGKTNKVGKYVELPKQLESSEKGEHFVITWKYSGKSPYRKANLMFEYKLSNEEHLETVVKEYPDLRKGIYRLQIENTGTSYRRRGRIEYWRVSVLADGETVARRESFLWRLFQEEKPADTQQGA